MQPHHGFNIHGITTLEYKLEDILHADEAHKYHKQVHAFAMIQNDRTKLKMQYIILTFPL